MTPNLASAQIFAELAQTICIRVPLTTRTAQNRYRPLRSQLHRVDCRGEHNTAGQRSKLRLERGMTSENAVELVTSARSVWISHWRSGQYFGGRKTGRRPEFALRDRSRDWVAAAAAGCL